MKKIITFILNFLLIICLCASCIVVILSKTILSKEYIMSSLEKSNFYDELNKSIQDDIDNYLSQAGIPNGTLKNLYSMNDLKNSVEATLDAVYFNKIQQGDTTNITHNIDSILANYEEYKNSKSIANQIANAYEKKVAIFPKYINIAGQKLSKILPIFNKGKTIIIIATIILLGIMLILIHNIKEIINTLGIAVLTTGVLSCAIKILVGSKFNNIFLLNDAFSGALIYIIKDFINIISTVGIIMVIVGLLGIIISAFIKKEDKKSSINH